MFYIDETRVINNMNSTKLEYINIYGLFGRYDIEIPFDKEVNIFIGENGLGKTTILNCIYYILEKKFTKLGTVNFKEIHIKFLNEEVPHKISIYDVNKYNQKLINSRQYKVESEYLEHILQDIKYKKNIENIYNEEEIEYVVRRFSRVYGIPMNIAKLQVLQYLETNELPDNKSNSKGNIDNIKKLIQSINENIKQKILYLPTYRRIEDDFEKLNISSDKFRDSELLIRFGMSDVQNSIDKLLTIIRKEAMDGFNKMTGVLLKQFTSSSNPIDSIYTYDRINIETVKIVLDRIGDEIEDDYKDKIIELIETREIYKFDYLYLLDLINKLIINYDLQKKYDDRIKNFANTCNKYLNGKQFYYNQSELSLKIQLITVTEIEERYIELTQLSSGEKQIVSLFSKLYLESDNDSIIIIDEPELSLSMKWQAMLLPDIMRSNNCKLLITVTHSPFIFENEFDLDAKEMRKLIKQLR